MTREVPAYQIHELQPRRTRYAVLIPVLPSQFDVWAAEETVKLLEQCAVYKERLKAAFVINRKIANTAIGRDVAKALEQYPQPVLQTVVMSPLTGTSP